MSIFRLFCLKKTTIFSGLLLSTSAFANIQFASQDSKISIAGGTVTFVNPVTNWNGTLNVQSGNIAGSAINFNQGTYRTAQGVSEVTGALTPSALKPITLSGSQKITAQPNIILGPISVQGSGNILSGQPEFLGTTTLQNSSAELQLNIQNKLSKSIIMNSGQITLLSDLSLGDDALLVGPGTVSLNKKRLHMPGFTSAWATSLFFKGATDIILNAKTSLSGTWTFGGGSAVLNGNGNILDLSSGGTLWISSGQEGQFTDIHIRGLGTPGMGTILFEDAAARVRLSNASIEISTNYTFTQGSIYVEGDKCSFLTGTNIMTLGSNFSLSVDDVTCFGDALAATATVNISPNIPDGLRLIYLKRGSIKALGEATGGSTQLSIDNSNAIIGWIKDTSNSVVAGGGNALAIDNSNAIIGWVRDTSNAVSGLLVAVSYATVASGGNALAVDNSNAIVGWIKDTSNAVNGLLVATSNAVAGLVVANSYAIVSINSLNIANSYAIINTNNLAVANSTAITGWIKDTSNSVVAGGGNALAVDNSNAIIGWIKDTSNSVNAGGGGGGGSAAAAVATIDTGLADIHFNSPTITMSYDYNISLNHRIRVHVNTVVDGNGHKISLAAGSGNMIVMDTGVTMTLENMVITNYGDNKVDFNTDTDIFFGANCVVELHEPQVLSRTWHMYGNGTINGLGNELTLGADPNYILIGQGSVVTLRDLRLNGIQDNTLRCLTDDSSIIMDNMTCVLSDNYSFTMGSIRFQRDVKMIGTNEFSYESAMGSTISDNAHLIWDYAFLFNYEPSISNKFGLIFTNSSAQLQMNGNALSVSTTGMQFTKGRIIVDNANILIGSGTTLSEAIIFGNGVADEDITLELMPAAELTLTSGIIDYQNLS